MKIFETTRDIYNRFLDEQSKDIYKARVIYSLTGDERDIKKTIRKYDVGVSKLINWLKEKEAESIAIYGAGHRGGELCSLLEGYNIVCFIDRYLAGGNKEGIPIVELDKFKNLYEKTVIIISNKNGSDDIKKELLFRGISEDRIFQLQPALEENGVMYFEDFVPHDEKEVFVDAGVYDGETTLQFVEWANEEYEQIYMFEPSSDYYDRFFKNVSSLKKCNWIKKGVWSKKEILKFFSRPDSDIATEKNLDGIKEHYAYNSGEWCEIPVVSLDDFFDGQKITFIKLDIEGSELEALKGCEQIIREQHPKLAICMYHKLEDPWTLPETIVRFYPGYKFYVRHYSMGLLDTVLYAIDEDKLR